MSTLDARLEQIETGEASAKEARGAIAELLEAGSEKGLQRLYATLGAWVWRALEGRRRDEELREWFDILRRVGAALASRSPAYAERIRSLYDLIQMSINTSQVVSARDVMKRQHVAEILRILGAAGRRPVDKTVIAREVGLKPANLSRILHIMTDARLVERTTIGKIARFSLTREGADALASLDRDEHREDRWPWKVAPLNPRSPPHLPLLITPHGIVANPDSHAKAAYQVAAARQPIAPPMDQQTTETSASKRYLKAKPKRAYAFAGTLGHVVSGKKNETAYAPAERAVRAKSNSSGRAPQPPRGS